MGQRYRYGLGVREVVAGITEIPGRITRMSAASGPGIPRRRRHAGLRHPMTPCEPQAAEHGTGNFTAFSHNESGLQDDAAD